ncbi:MAG: HPr kinase/phosphorylase [Minwuia sp.]|uniref:HPr kinase/phosphorylase n=1 Tax=Minwuia sp. TaxID=2493630 RepID=UPI003A89FDB5
MPSSRNAEAAGPLHANAVQVAGQGLLIRGPAGSGKSDLTLRLVEAGALLVADDRTEVRVEGERLVARAPSVLRELIEVRGLGVIRLPAERCLAECRLSAVVDLVGDPTSIQRMPRIDESAIEGVRLPLLEFWPFEASAAVKLRMFALTLNGTARLVE